MIGSRNNFLLRMLQTRAEEGGFVVGQAGLVYDFGHELLTHALTYDDL